MYKHFSWCLLLIICSTFPSAIKEMYFLGSAKVQAWINAEFFFVVGLWILRKSRFTVKTQGRYRLYSHTKSVLKESAYTSLHLSCDIFMQAHSRFLNLLGCPWLCSGRSLPVLHKEMKAQWEDLMLLLLWSCRGKLLNTVNWSLTWSHTANQCRLSHCSLCSTASILWFFLVLQVRSPDQGPYLSPV